MIIKKYKIDNDKKDTLDKFMLANELELWKDNVRAVEYCLNNNLNQYEAYIIEPSTKKYFVYKNKFIQILNKAIEIFEKYEEYELCTNVTNIKNKINKKGDN